MSLASGPADTPLHPLQWREKGWTGAALMALSIVPLLWPDVPPLLDLPGHMGRYRVQLDLAASPDLQQYFGFHWQVIGNLGVDLLVQLLGPLIGLEPAVELIVCAIPALSVGGMLRGAREAHGQHQRGGLAGGLGGRVRRAAA